MALSIEEYDLVINRTKEYPHGCGYKWGFGPLTDRNVIGTHGEKIDEVLKEHPEYATEYGWPALVLAAGRGDLSWRGMERALHDIEAVYGEESSNYTRDLNYNKHRVVQRLTAIKDARCGTQAS